MGYTAPTWVNGKPPAINATRLNDLCTTVQTLDETMPTKQDKLTFDNVPTSGSSNPVKSSGIYTALQGKQSSLTFDNAPTQGSTNPVTSGGVYTAIQQGGGGTITLDDVPTAGSSNAVKSSGIYNALQGKQGTLTFDSTPTQGSTNPVTSGGVYAAIQASGGGVTFDDVPTAGSNNAVKSNGIYYHYIGAGRLAGSTAGAKSTAEGDDTTASGNSSHAEGNKTSALGQYSHAEGSRTTANSFYDHAEGNQTFAGGGPSHSEGSNTRATGIGSHAEGSNTEASGHYSHAEGKNTVANHSAQHVFGEYNTPDPSTETVGSRGMYVEIVGNGAAAATSNARTMDWSGNMTIAGTLTQSSDSRLKTVEGEIPDVSEVHAVRFRWNDVNGQHDDLEHVGYIAQDVEKVAPFMVKKDSNGYKALDYIAFLCAKMEILERRVKELEEKKE